MCAFLVVMFNTKQGVCVVLRLMIFNGKGGCGKTNLARHMAVAAAMDGLKVATVDFDPQRGLSQWWGRRPASAKPIKNFEASWEDAEELIGLGNMLDDDGPYDITIIDTPAYGGYSGQEKCLKLLMKGANAILMPSRPTSDDADSAIPMMKLARREAAPSAFVLNATIPQANILKIKRRLNDTGEMCPIEIGHRTIFANAADDGKTVFDLPKTAKITLAVEEMLGVWSYARRQMGMTNAD